MIRASVALACLALVGACGQPSDVPIGEERLGLCAVRATDSLQQTALGPTDRSHWLQPWRGYLDTWPASRMREAVGIVMSDMSRSALWAAAGGTRITFNAQWDGMDVDAPTRLRADRRAELRARLTAFQAQGLRPTILLYGHEGAPAPLRQHKVIVAEAAAKGATRLRLDRASLPSVTVGRTGLSNLTGYKAAEVLFSSIDGTGAAQTGFVTLSKPLPADVPVGSRDAATLRFAPFSRPTRADGTPNPLFEETLQGWLDYVKAVVLEAAAAIGSESFDVEIWNELVTGAMFLDINNYYDPPLDTGPGDASQLIPRAILERTVKMLRNPALGVARVGIGDGFANTRWTDAGANEVAGVTAMDRHVSIAGLEFPADAIVDESRPLDARGAPAGMRLPDGRWQERFTPTYQALFPELVLTAILPYKWRRPGQLTRDLSPIATVDANGVRHGRQTHPPGGMPPALWLTSVNTVPTPADSAAPRLGPQDRWHFHAKAVMRTLSAYVGKGVEALFFFTSGTELALIDTADPEGGEVMRVLGRFTRAFAGPAAIGTPRKVALASVTGCDTAKQFDGDGTAAHPPLWNRDVVAFFPFQIDDRRFVVPTYVMTRNLATLYHPARPATDVTRYDMPGEVYALAIEGVDGRAALVEASDPLTGGTVEVTVIERGARRIVVTLPLTDAPRLLGIAEP